MAYFLDISDVLLSLKQIINRMPEQCSSMHIHSHIDTCMHTHTHLHAACSQQMFYPPLPSQKPTSERIFPPQGRGAEPLKKTAAPQHKTKHQRGKKNVLKTFQKGKEGKKAKDFLIHPLLRWLVFGSATFFMCEKAGL